jgi:hypothetical protein
MCKLSVILELRYKYNKQVGKTKPRRHIGEEEERHE